MTPLRFRVWLRNKMITDLPYIGFDHDGSLVLRCGPEGEEWTETFEDNGYVLMQSTGLKDKNGKEIFEGDVVRVTCQFGEREYCVECRDGSFMLIIPSNEHFNGHLYNLPSLRREPSQKTYYRVTKNGWEFERNNKGVSPRSMPKATEAEVIGNIYENTDLLPKA